MSDTIAPTYYRVSPKFWSDPMVRAWDEDQRTLALYILTCEHRNTEGLFRLPVLYGCHDLEWDTDRYRAALDRLTTDGFVEWDEDAQVLLIVKALGTQSPDNINQAKGAVKKLLGVPASPLDRRFGDLAAHYSRRLYDVLPERFTGGDTPPPTGPDGNGSAKGSRNGSAKGSGNGSANPTERDTATDTQPSSSCSGSYSSSPSARAHTREPQTAPAVEIARGDPPRPPETHLRAVPNLDATAAADELLEHLPGRIAARVHGRHRERLGRTVAGALATGWTTRRLAGAVKGLDADLGGLDQLDDPRGTAGAIAARIGRLGAPPETKPARLPCAACDDTGRAGDVDDAGYVQPCPACRPQGFHETGHTVGDDADSIGNVIQEAIP